MRLYLDTEFNGFGGELISLALVADNGDELYVSFGEPKEPHPWIKEHVLPYIAWGNPILADPMAEVCLFLGRWKGAEIVADWPTDIEHLCRVITFAHNPEGFRIPGEYTFRLITRMDDYASEVPHNALSDARALRDYCRDWKT